MIEFMLAIHVCRSAADCRWVHMPADDTHQYFISEDVCREVGRTYRQDETVFGYKCVALLNEWSWRLPTPAARAYGTNQGGGMGRVGPIRPSLETMARKGLWPTPHGICVPSKRRAGPSGNELGRAVRREQFPTPRAIDGTDPPYAFGGGGAEHALSATVAIVLRETAKRLAKGRWMLVMCASSWRSTAYMVEAVRGVIDPVRIGTWCKPEVRTKARTTGWQWASVNVIAFRKGKAENPMPAQYLDHITAAPVVNGRRAELPAKVADWMVDPFCVPGGLLLDPFAGSGAIVEAAERHGMTGVGYEKHLPLEHVA